MSFLTDTYQKLEQARDIAHETEEMSKQAMKSYYDRISKKQSFEENYLVLVLLPTNTNKLLAKWKGPYPIKKKLNETT